MRYETASALPGSESRMAIAKEVEKRTALISQINAVLKKHK
ncbi:hypothetical protein [Bacillus suaedae]|nr:hypothetical protein [Bacillus suaedae]